MKSKHPFPKTTPKIDSNIYCTRKKLHSDELIQNFRSALNSNFSGSSKNISQSSTTTASDKQIQMQTAQKAVYKNFRKTKTLYNQYECQQEIQKEPIQLVSSAIAELRRKSHKLEISPIYFVKHEGIKTVSRSILMDWITQLCSEFNFQRETCQSAKTLIDAYLSATSKLPLKLLQLVGITCLLISSKVQESFPKSLMEMACATACLYNVNEIRQSQIQILAKLRFGVRVLTYDQCINGIMKEWQKFRQSSVDEAEFALNSQSLSPDLFRINLRRMLDVITLDGQSLNHNYLTLTLSLLLILFGYAYGWFSYDQIQYSFIYNCRYLLKSSTYFLMKMEQFLNYTGYRLSELTSTIQFVSSYFFLIGVENKEGKMGDIQAYDELALCHVKFRKQLIREIQMIFQ